MTDTTHLLREGLSDAIGFVGGGLGLCRWRGAGARPGPTRPPTIDADSGNWPLRIAPQKIYTLRIYKSTP